MYSQVHQRRGGGNGARLKVLIMSELKYLISELPEISLLHESC